jgi:glycosidase
MEYIRYLKDRVEGIGYDGFRYDAVKYYDSWIVQSIQEWQKCFGVAEFWDGDKNKIKAYLDYVNGHVPPLTFPSFMHCVRCVTTPFMTCGGCGTAGLSLNRPCGL